MAKAKGQKRRHVEEHPHCLGIDVGKSGHWACLLDASGEAVAAPGGGALVENRRGAVRELHALHAFNARELLPESGVTIDEALVRLAQLNALKRVLGNMRSRRPKERVDDRCARTDRVEWRHANYDVARAQADYLEASERISALQLELDLVNQTRTFEVPID